MAKRINMDYFDESLSMYQFNKRTIAQTKEVLDYFGVKNSLSQYLSAGFNYKMERMEDLYKPSGGEDAGAKVASAALFCKK